MIVTVKGRSATFPITGKQVVVCVLLNVRKPPPQPDPAPEPTPADPGSVPAPAAAASLDLVTHMRALESAVAAGSEVGFRMRILNRGPVTATAVRIVPVLRQGRARVRALRLGVRGGLCVSVRGRGACVVPTLAPGASATVRISARSRRGAFAPVRLVGAARPREPERRLRNDVDRSRVRILRPGGACAARAPVGRAAC